MNYCTNCGEKLNRGPRFCPNCGAALSAEESAKSIPYGAAAVQAAPTKAEETFRPTEAAQQNRNAYRVKLNSLGFSNLQATVKILQETLHYSAEDAHSYAKVAPVEITTDMPLDRAQELAEILANHGLNVSVVNPDRVEQVVQGHTTIVNQYYMNASPETVSSKNRLVAALLCFFLGIFGVHRFYVGKVGTGILWLLTLGFWGIGWLIDFIMIVCGAFKDKAGLPVKTV